MSVVKERTVRAVDAALDESGELAVFALKDSEVDQPLQEELFEIGSMVRIVKNVRLPEGKRSAILARVGCDYSNFSRKMAYSLVKLRLLKHKIKKRYYLKNVMIYVVWRRRYWQMFRQGPLKSVLDSKGLTPTV